MATAKDQFNAMMQSLRIDLEKDEEINRLYSEVIEANKKGKCCGEFGDDESTRLLMTELRKRMREQKFAPNCKLQNMDWKKKEGKEDFYRKRTELVGKTEKYKKLFPKTYNYECKTMPINTSYNFDGWNYGEKKYQNEEWIFPVGKKQIMYTHFYYNELDHYLTYLIGFIRRKGEDAKDSCGECGLKILKSEIEEKQECVAPTL